jgi:hypothetical protein
MEPGAVVAIVGTLAVFGIPLSAIWTHHLREIAKIKAEKGDGGKGNAEILREVQAMRDEMATLRDTTTKFDMSFDAALSRLEQRMDKAEQNIADIRPAARPNVTPTTETENAAVLRARNS